MKLIRKTFHFVFQKKIIISFILFVFQKFHHGEFEFEWSLLLIIVVINLKLCSEVLDYASFVCFDCPDCHDNESNWGVACSWLRSMEFLSPVELSILLQRHVSLEIHKVQWNEWLLGLIFFLFFFFSFIVKKALWSAGLSFKVTFYLKTLTLQATLIVCIYI